MVFKEKKENNGWTNFWYTTTWRMWYEFILCAAEELIKDDLMEHLGRVAFRDMSEATECLEAVKANDFDIRQCQDLCNEHGSVIVSGFSKIMECPMQFEFHNQTNLCSVAIPSKMASDLIEKYGNDVFTNYVNSVEIKAHIRHTLISEGLYKPEYDKVSDSKSQENAQQKGWFSKLFSRKD